MQIEQGQRKLIATIATMVVGIVAEKYFGGLSDNLAILIGSALGLFVGGNAMEYVAQIKSAHRGGVIDLPPEKEEVVEVGAEPAQDVMASLEMLHNHVKKVDEACGNLFRKNDAKMGELNESIKSLEEGLALQGQQTQQLVKLINQQRGVDATK